MKDQEPTLPPRLLDGDGPGGALLRRAERQAPPVPPEAVAWDRLLARLARDAGRRRLQLGLAAIGGACAGAAALYLVIAPVPAPVAQRPPAARVAPSGARVTTPAIATAPSSPARAPSPSPSRLAPGEPARPVASRPPAGAPVDAPRIQLGRAAVGLPIGPAELIDQAQVVLAAGGRARGFASDDAATVELDAGTLELQVRKRAGAGARRFEVAAGSYRFTVLGTRFRVVRTRRQVTLEVSEGRVAVSAGARSVAVIGAGGRWDSATDVGEPAAASAIAPAAPAPAAPAPAPVPTSPAPPATVPAPPAVPAASTAARSKCGPRAMRDPRDGLDCYLADARGADLSAEVGLYEAARLQRDALGDPTAALATLREHRRRFPSGVLRIEVGLSLAELLPRLGRYQEALDETTSLLAVSPRGERLGELQLLRGHILREGFHDHAGAERAYAAAMEAGAGGAPARAADPAAFWRAVCLETIGRRAEARVAYQRYLARPRAALASEARGRLQALEREHSDQGQALSGHTATGGSP